MNSPRKVKWRKTVETVAGLLAVLAPLAMLLLVAAEPVAAQAGDPVSELDILNIINNIHKLLRNIGYIVGPLLVFYGLLKRSVKKATGTAFILAGAVLFGVNLALDVFLSLIVKIVM